MRPVQAILVGAVVVGVGCGGGDDAARPSAAAQVRAVVERFAKASADRDYRTICDELVAPSLLRGIESFGLPCEVAFERGLRSTTSPRLAVAGVRVRGRQAAVRVHTTAAGQRPSDDTLLLVRDARGWRIAALDAPASATGATGPTGPTDPYNLRPRSGDD